MILPVRLNWEKRQICFPQCKEAGSSSTLPSSDGVHSPVPLIAFGVFKILHSFGFSLQAWYQYFTAFFTVISFAASAFLWRWRKYREWVLVFWAAALVLSAQSFWFKGDIRYKVTVVDLPGLFVCALFAFEAMQRFGAIVPGEHD